MTTITTSSQVIPESVHIPYVTADEAHTLMGEALERFLKLVETLAPEDWDKPTACTAWSVRDMLAHQAGGYASGTGYREMIRQYSTLPKKGQLPEDAINDLQVRERAAHSPTKLIAELRQVGPVAIQKWAYQFRLVKPIAIPHPVGGLLSLRHLMWIIHSRDTWMHRLDICRATGREFHQTPEHDGRIVALVMRDLGRTLHKKLGGQAVIFDLGGVAGGTWKVGSGEATATIQMDALDFNIFASGRFNYAEGHAKATLNGDMTLAELALQKAMVLY
jgi:uncharacterized protein (TIGR03083 family)